VTRPFLLPTGAAQEWRQEAGGRLPEVLMPNPNCCSSGQPPLRPLLPQTGVARELPLLLILIDWHSFKIQLYLFLSASLSFPLFFIMLNEFGSSVNYA
jgi:hypothetical protein